MAHRQTSQARRRDLDRLLSVYRDPDDDKVHDTPIWEAWLRKSGELPPDFAALPSVAGLPDMLRFGDGAPVQTADEWRRRRSEMLDTLRHWMLGDWPENVAMAVHPVSSENDAAEGCTRQRLDLLLGPTRDAVTKLSYTGPASYQAAYLKIEVCVPRGEGPFPVLIGPDFRAYGGQRGSWRVPQRPPSLTVYQRALQRGYMTCTFDQNDAFFCRNVFTWCDCTESVWWAWGISRCIDYLLTRDDVDATRLATAGHSRGGSTALMAAALDERIAACVCSHTGAASPMRYSAEKYGSQTLEVRTRLFPHVTYPRLRFFCGRENKLPFDSHWLVGLVAPRWLLLTEGVHDPVGQLLGAQLVCEAVRRVYVLLGHPERVNNALDPGGHSLSEDAMERWLDWLDLRFGRRDGAFVDQFHFDYTFERWREATGQALDVRGFRERGLDDLLQSPGGGLIKTRRQWQAKRDDIVGRMLSIVGELPAYAPPPPSPLQRVEVFDRHYRFLTEQGLVTDQTDLGGGLVCYLTYQERLAQQGRLPVAVYLHAYCDQRGLAWERHEGAGVSPGERLALHGFLAVQFDQFGSGRRNHEATLSYFVEHPDRSALGVMIQDVRRIMDSLPAVPFAHAQRVALVGYSLGGAVALHTAALDERVGAVASVCGVGSLRRDVHGDQTEGLARWCVQRPTLPRLGYFIGEESRIPYDFHDVLALIAPRLVLIVAPRLDQDWLPDDVRTCVDAARRVYRLLGAARNIELLTPDDFNRFPPQIQNVVADWLCEKAH